MPEFHHGGAPVIKGNGSVSYVRSDIICNGSNAMFKSVLTEVTFELINLTISTLVLLVHCALRNRDVGFDLGYHIKSNVYERPNIMLSE